MKRIWLVLLMVFVFACESDEDKAGRFFLMGNNSLTERNYKEAIRLYTEALQKNPEMKEALNNRGVAFYKDKKYPQAIKDYTQVIEKIDSVYFEARKNRADAYYAAGTFDQALSDLQYLSRAYPDSAWVDFKMGLNLVGLQQYDAAVDAFDESLKKNADNVETIVNKANAYYFSGNHEEASRFLKQAETLDPSEPNIFNTQSLIATSAGQLDEAIALVNKALSLDINNPYFNNNRGYIYLLKGDLDKAEQDINLGIKGDPQNPWAYRNKGIFYFMKKKYGDALRNFEQAALYDNSIPRLNYYHGATLVKLGRTEEACVKLEISANANEEEGMQLYNKTCGGA